MTALRTVRLAVAGSQAAAGGGQGLPPAVGSWPPAVGSWPPAVATGRARAEKDFRLDLRLGRDRLELRLGGNLSIASARPLAVVLASLNRLVPQVAIHAAGVRAADADGLRPLFEISRYRHDHALTPLLVIEYSEAMRTLLTQLQVPCTRRLDVAAWDAAEARAQHRGQQHCRHLRLVTGTSESGPAPRGGR